MSYGHHTTSGMCNFNHLLQYALASTKCLYDISAEITGLQLRYSQSLEKCLYSQDQVLWLAPAG